MKKFAILVALALVCNVYAQYDSDPDDENSFSLESAGEEAETKDDLEERQYGFNGPASNTRPWAPPHTGPSGGVRPYPQPGGRPAVQPVPLPGRPVRPFQPIRPGRPLCRRDPYTGRVVCTRPNWGY